MTRICVDKSRCEGSQLCVGTYPLVFGFGDDGFAYVIDEHWSTTVGEDALDELITLCPTDAIGRVRVDVTDRLAGEQ